MSAIDLRDHIRSIPDFPKPGILYYDISTLLAHAEAWSETVRRLADVAGSYKPDLLASIESRGFVVAAPVAHALGCGFVMVRKRGKLPGETVSYEYTLEYGTDHIEVQIDALEPGQRVVLVDDLLATGGTAAASHTLLRQLGAEVVAAAFIIELSFLGGRERLDLPITSLVAYDK